MNKSLLPLALVSLLAIPAAHADDASKRAKISELLTILKVDQVPQQIIAGANQQTEALGHREFGATETPDQQKQVTELHDKVVTLLHSAVDWKILQPEFVTAYSAAYTEPEIDGILAFYKSPSGQALLNKGPEMGQKSNQIVSQHMSAVQPQLREIVQNFSKANAPAGSAPAGGGRTGTSPSRPAPSLNGAPAKTTTPPPSN